MIRLGLLGSLPFSPRFGRPSWLPEAGILKVKRIERWNQRLHRWDPTANFVVVDPASTANLKLAGEVLMHKQPRNAVSHHVPKTLDSFVLTVDHIDASWSRYADWLASDRGFSVVARQQLREWKRLPGFQRQLIHQQMQRRSKRYELARSSDLRVAREMLESGLMDELGRWNPVSRLPMLAKTDRALGSQQQANAVSAKANRKRRSLAEELVRHQMDRVAQFVETGDFWHTSDLLVKLPAYGVNYLKRQSDPSLATIRTVMDFELYFSVLYRELSAVGRRKLDPSELSVPSPELDFSSLPHYADLADVVLGRVKDLLASYDELDDAWLHKSTETIQMILRYRHPAAGIGTSVWMAPELDDYLVAS